MSQTPKSLAIVPIVFRQPSQGQLIRMVHPAPRWSIVRTFLLVIAIVGFSGASTTWAQDSKPRPNPTAAKTTEGSAYSVQPDVVYGHKEGMALTFDVLQPEEANGLGICFMVSGGWYSNWFPPQAAGQNSLFGRMLDSGYTVFLVRHGSAPRFKVPEAVDDVRKAVSHIKQNAAQWSIDPDKLGVCGGSAGGHLSTMLGTTGEKEQRVAVVACYYPPTDLRPYVTNPKSVKDFPALDFDNDLAESVSPALHASDDDAPTLLVHGDKDRLVPLSHSENLKAELDKVSVPCELIVIEGAAHGFQGDDQKRAETAVIQWFDRYLKSESK